MAARIGDRHRKFRDLGLENSVIQAQKFRDPGPKIPWSMPRKFFYSECESLFVRVSVHVCMYGVACCGAAGSNGAYRELFGKRLRARIALVNVQYLIPKNWGFSPGAAHSESFDRDLHRSNQIKKGKGIRESFARNFHKIFLIILIKIQCTNAFSCYCIQILALIYTL